ncbi:MAG: hypothetical protein EOM20_20230 [Spartobacteria bacterium]|nr:hypothetical protein [Spartobacteria bacterium]
MSSLIQPHLASLRSDKTIEICNTQQRRNRKHKINDRSRLEKLVEDKVVSLPSPHDLKNDEAKNISIIEVEKRLSSIDETFKIITEFLRKFEDNFEDTKIRLEECMTTMKSHASLPDPNVKVACRCEQSTKQEFAQHHWRSPIDNDSTITWADYFFDDPDCEKPRSKNESFLERFPEPVS